MHSDAPNVGVPAAAIPEEVCSLQGKSILIVEDEFMIAMDYAVHLEKLGARILGPVSTVPQALTILREQVLDGAILDIDLQGTKSYMVADALRERRIGFVFATGYNDVVIPDRFADIVRCEKPASPEYIADVLMHVCRSSGNGTAV